MIISSPRDALLCLGPLPAFYAAWRDERADGVAAAPRTEWAIEIIGPLANAGGIFSKEGA
jgi:hypothetical protein